MYEVRLHGRGGQGTVLGSTILAKALVAEGKHVTAIPSFGFERRGAPVAAYLRFDAKEIRRMNRIYTPDCIVCIDPTVRRAVDIFEGMRQGGTLVQTSKQRLEAFALPACVAIVGLCDAVAIALELFGKAITNTVMLGAFARTTGLVSLDSLRQALDESQFRDGGLAQNAEALQRGYEETVVHHLEVAAPA
jgi:pyruvate ferredoxin oxidoreductase gamma subunit/phenylglyoxylate dehydrogenase gamma subunit